MVALMDAPRATHPPRILMLYGSLRERSFSRLATEEAARILRKLGAEVRIFNPAGLPLPDSVPADHPKVQELRELSLWSEGQVWCSPERHGAMTGIMKAQIDWLPLSLGAVRPTQGRTLAVMQVCGGSQSFNAVNQLRILGRWMRMVTIPNQSSVAKAFNEFDADGSDEAVLLLRPHRRRDGGIGEVHVAAARSLRLSHRPLLGARGKRRGTVEAGEPGERSEPSHEFDIVMGWNARSCLTSEADGAFSRRRPSSPT